MASKFGFSIIILATFVAVSLQACDPVCSGDTPVCYQTQCAANRSCYSGSDCQGVTTGADDTAMSWCNRSTGYCVVEPTCTNDGASCESMNVFNTANQKVNRCDGTKCVTTACTSEDATPCANANDGRANSPTALNVCNGTTCVASVDCDAGGDCNGVKSSTNVSMEFCDTATEKCILQPDCTAGGNECNNSERQDKNGSVLNFCSNSKCTNVDCSASVGACSSATNGHTTPVNLNICDGKVCVASVRCKEPDGCKGVKSAADVSMEFCDNTSKTCIVQPTCQASGTECNGLNITDGDGYILNHCNGTVCTNVSCKSSTAACTSANNGHDTSIALNVCDGNVCVASVDCSNNRYYRCFNAKSSSDKSMGFCNGSVCVEEPTCTEAGTECNSNLVSNTNGELLNKCVSGKCTKVACDSADACKTATSGHTTAVNLPICHRNQCLNHVSCKEENDCEGVTDPATGVLLAACVDKKCAAVPCTSSGNECGLQISWSGKYTNYTCNSTTSVCDIVVPSCSSNADCEATPYTPYCNTDKCASCEAGGDGFCTGGKVCDTSLGGCVKDLTSARSTASGLSSSARTTEPATLKQSITSLFSSAFESGDLRSNDTSKLISSVIDSIEKNVDMVKTPADVTAWLGSVDLLLTQSAFLTAKRLDNLGNFIEGLSEHVAETSGLELSAANITEFGDAIDKFIKVTNDILSPVVRKEPLREADKGMYLLGSALLTGNTSSTTPKLFSNDNATASFVRKTAADLEGTVLCPGNTNTTGDGCVTVPTGIASKIECKSNEMVDFGVLKIKYNTYGYGVPAAEKFDSSTLHISLLCIEVSNGDIDDDVELENLTNPFTWEVAVTDGYLADDSCRTWGDQGPWTKEGLATSNISSDKKSAKCSGTKYFPSVFTTANTGSAPSGSEKACTSNTDCTDIHTPACVSDKCVSCKSAATDFCPSGKICDALGHCAKDLTAEKNKADALKDSSSKPPADLKTEIGNIVGDAFADDTPSTDSRDIMESLAEAVKSNVANLNSEADITALTESLSQITAKPKHMTAGALADAAGTIDDLADRVLKQSALQLNDTQLTSIGASLTATIDGAEEALSKAADQGTTFGEVDKALRTLSAAALKGKTSTTAPVTINNTKIKASFVRKAHDKLAGEKTCPGSDGTSGDGCVELPDAITSAVSSCTGGDKAVDFLVIKKGYNTNGHQGSNLDGGSQEMSMYCVDTTANTKTAIEVLNLTTGFNWKLSISQGELTSSSCTFWNSTTSKWATDGVTTSNLAADKKSCTCTSTHMTEFSATVVSTGPETDDTVTSSGNLVWLSGALFIFTSLFTF